VSKVLVAHLPHLVFVVAGVVAFFWAGYRQPRRVAGPRAQPEKHPTHRSSPSPVRHSVARRGLLALVPLIGAGVTGGVIYGINLARDRPSGAVIWAHVGISLAALLLVAYKLASLGGARLRSGLRLERVPEFLSLLLGALLVPLLATGILDLLRPGAASFVAYSHLIASAWWAGLLLWHLWRYLLPALRSLAKSRVHAGGLPPSAHVEPTRSPDRPTARLRR
jgi:hypothetical protein